ncbi:hypothetical protein MIN45_P0747 [Methylomarinovum tepidoasis]|uniref:Shikimate kinase n=1 Tax=Methylomarinovum tepidoasis TaxID=2840183 RepID=A0AAU9BY12_9GAMM|nr:hypothetical protein [Methylomarinovum sp. IN45]BCX88378.1 hypothetical protein MIN45_P0747 [Methylomarinovum sp. IN45]
MTHLSKTTIFHTLKYLIYLLLAYDAWQYFQQDYAASRQILGAGFSYQQFVESFAITIDVTSWLVLLLCFEVETVWLPPERLRGWVSWLLHGIRVVCYFFVLSSYYGYIAKYLLFTHTAPLPVADVCELAGRGYTWLQGLDEYPPLDAASCQRLRELPLALIAGTRIVADLATLEETRFMAWVDVLYATTWLLVIAILELDVYLKERGKLKGWVLKISEIIKAVLYLGLLGGAVFWGLKGEFLDFWDSFLWLAAFVLIDLDVFGITADAEPAS